MSFLSELNWDMRMFETRMKHRVAWLAAVLSLVLLASGQIAAKEKADKEDKAGAPTIRKTADENEAAMLKLKDARFSKEGADTCVSCHDEENEYPIFLHAWS